MSEVNADIWWEAISDRVNTHGCNTVAERALWNTHKEGRQQRMRENWCFMRGMTQYLEYGILGIQNVEYVRLGVKKCGIC